MNQNKFFFYLCIKLFCLVSIKLHMLNIFVVHTVYNIWITEFPHAKSISKQNHTSLLSLELVPPTSPCLPGFCSLTKAMPLHATHREGREREKKQPLPLCIWLRMVVGGENSNNSKKVWFSLLFLFPKVLPKIIMAVGGAENPPIIDNSGGAQDCISALHPTWCIRGVIKEGPVVNTLLL